jgi:hypothetical protein
MRNDAEIMQHLRWIYLERRLCNWCRHPDKTRLRRGLCSSCYRLALDFKSEPSLPLANAIDFARSEGTINAVDWPIDALEVEMLFSEISNLAFSWRKDSDDPFWHSANTWSANFTNAQRRLLFHYFSLISREVHRRRRRGRAAWLASELDPTERTRILRNAVGAVRDLFQANRARQMKPQPNDR